MTAPPNSRLLPDLIHLDPEITAAHYAVIDREIGAYRTWISGSGGRVTNIILATASLNLSLIHIFTGVEIEFEMTKEHVQVAVEVKSNGKTGVEMEAITGVSAALLTIWDMVKSVEKDENGQYPSTRISDIEVIKKEKGE